MNPFSKFFVILGVSVLLSSCGSDSTSSVASCITGEASACICSDGPRVGVQICGDDGTFGACDCSGTTPANGGSGDNVTTGNNGNPMDAGTADGGGPGEDSGTTSFNACGGSGQLPNQPGSVCGECNDGFYVCDGLEDVRCAFDSERNACNSCAKLNGSPGDPCGPCKIGVSECNGSGVLECSATTEPNPCGGCSSLAETPGFFCQNAMGEPGTLACDSPDSVRCTAADENVCGGQAVLSGQPASPCGVCEDGRYTCASQDAVICNGASPSQNACGGCGVPLIAPPDTPCGACGGTWQCDGTQAVVCSAPMNLCGGCLPLAQTPGADCGGTDIVTCDGSLSTTCKDGATHNACGGTNLLANEPGESCGTCGDGKYVCLGNSATACVEDDLRNNACGGCTPLNARPGDPCAPGSVWACDGPDAVTCELSMNNSGLNACGGTQMLDGRPGTVCEECGTWACDSVNRDLVFCVGGSPGTLEDENNCGMCGMKCLPGEACVSGQCEFDTVVELATSTFHVVARMAGGDVYAWGFNDRTGPIGVGSTRSTFYEPQKTLVIDDAIDITATDPSASSGAGNSCAIRANGDVWCWGANNDQQLGVSQSILFNSSIPVQVPGIDNAIQIESALGTICALKSDRTLWCWGNNSDGQLGRGTTGGSSGTPTQVTGLTSVQDFALSRSTVCALETTGVVSCWGDDQFGGLGDGTLSTSDTNTPAPISGSFSAFSSLEPVATGFVALNADGAHVWGRAADPTSGSTGSVKAAPVIVPGTAGAFRIFGANDVYFVEDSAGTIKMWGTDEGQSGVLASSSRVAGLEIGPIPGSASVAQIAGIRFGSFVLMDDGSLWTSGRAAYLGDGQIRITSSPTVSTREFHPIPSFLPVGTELGNCRDGADNDRDGLVDCADPDCADDIGSVEGTGAISDIAGITWYRYLGSTCGNGAAYREQTYAWTAPRTGRFEVTSGASTARLIVEAYDSCTTGAVALDCSDDDLTTSPDDSTIEFAAIGGQTYYIVLHLGFSGTVSVDITEVP